MNGDPGAANAAANVVNGSGPGLQAALSAARAQENERIQALHEELRERIDDPSRGLADLYAHIPGERSPHPLLWWSPTMAGFRSMWMTSTMPFKEVSPFKWSVIKSDTLRRGPIAPASRA